MRESVTLPCGEGRWQLEAPHTTTCTPARMRKDAARTSASTALAFALATGSSINACSTTAIASLPSAACRADR